MLAEAGTAPLVTLKDQIASRNKSRIDMWKDIYHDLYSIGSQFADGPSNKQPRVCGLQEDSEDPMPASLPIVLDPTLLEKKHGEET